MERSVPKYVKIAEGIYVGAIPPRQSLDQAFLTTSDVKAVIALNIRLESASVEILEYALPIDEMMDSEIPKTLSKLGEICEEIKELRDGGVNVLVACNDGRNRSMLVVGYYMIKYGRMNPRDVVRMLEQFHFTEQERLDQERDDEAVRLSVLSGGQLQRTQEDIRAADARRGVRCLTMQSFRRALMKCGGPDGARGGEKK
jgi:hypothetical protein